MALGMHDTHGNFVFKIRRSPTLSVKWILKRRIALGIYEEYQLTFVIHLQLRTLFAIE